MSTTTSKVIDAAKPKKQTTRTSVKCQGEATSANGKKRGPSFGHKTGKTVRKFLQAVNQKLAIEGTPAEGSPGADLKGLKLLREVRDSAAVIAFDKSYKQYIYDILIRKFGFKESKYITEDKSKSGEGYKYVYGKDKLDIECLYHDVLAKLLLGAMDGFDTSQPRVGKGAFRNYLKKVIASVYNDATKPDLVPVYNPDGTKQYTNEEVKDKDGKPKLDAKGNKVYKPKTMTLKSFNAKHIENAIANGSGRYGGVSGSARKLEWTSGEISKVRVFFMKIAYLKLVERKMKAKSAKERWGLGAMLDIFEHGMDEGDVLSALLENGIIRDRVSFDVAKTTFLNEWSEIARFYQGKILKPVKIGQKISACASPKAKPTRRGVYMWHPIVSRYEAEQYILKLHRETKAKVGPERFRFINDNFERMMIGLVQVADEKAATKNAKRYEPEEGD